MFGKHLVKAYSRTQANVALSSGEAELYALVTAASEGLGMRTMARDVGQGLVPHVNVDASAAVGIASRKGLGRVRHLDTQSLWVQDAVRQKKVELIKVRGTQHPADMMTKYLDCHVLHEMTVRLNLEAREGRPEIAPKMAENFDYPNGTS